MSQVSYGQMTIADLTDNYQVQLSPESASFAGGTSSAKDGNITVIVSTLQGNKRIAHTIGTPPEFPKTGMTITDSTPGTANSDGSFKINVTNLFTETSGYITIPITVDGVVYNRRFSYSVGREGTSVTITESSVKYQKGTSGTVKPTGTWGTSIPSLSENEYLWTQTIVTYSDGTSTEAYSVSRNAKNGTNGTSPTVSSTKIEYQQSTNGTTPPTGTWQSSAPTATAGQYMWTRTTITYSDSATAVSYTVSKNGTNGTSISISSTSVTYQKGTSGTTKPTGTWGTSIPSVGEGEFLWTKTVVNYSDGSSTESYGVSRNATNGTSPTVSSTVTEYVQSDSGTSTPTSGWNTTPPTATAGKYMWTRVTVTYSDNAKAISYSVSKNGTNGTNGVNTATVYLYKMGTSVPAVPNGNTTYTFSNKTLTGSLNGWTQAIPTSGTGECYVTAAVASSNDTTDTIASSEWSTPIQFNGSNGTDGYNQATIFLYQRATSAPSKPTATPTYTFSTGALSTVPSGWSRNVPTNNGNPCYVTTAVAISQTSTATISGWSDVVKLVEDGVSVTSVNSSKSGDETTITITLSDGTSKQFIVNDGAVGATAQWYYGTDLQHTSGTADISTTLTDGVVVGSMYLNPDTSLCYRCTNISGTTATWTYAGDLTTGVFTAVDNMLTQREIFNRLTNNQTNQGVYLDGTNLYINATMIQSGVFTVPDPEDPNGDPLFQAGQGAVIIKALNKLGMYFEFGDDGVIIGKQDSNMKLRLTNDEMGFYQGDNKVAYINSDKLHITNANIVNSLALGNFAFIPQSNGNLSFRKVK